MVTRTIVPNTFLTAAESFDMQGFAEYFMPFRPCHPLKKETGLSCHLCGTSGFPNRWAVLEHCESSRQHLVLRNQTLFCGNYHPEITEMTNLLQRIQRLPSRYYRWSMERELLHYISAKEASMAEVMSRNYAWHQVWKRLETFELRYYMSILECALWKEHVLQFDSTIRFSSLSELRRFFQDHGHDYDSYRVERQESSQAYGIIIGVIPY